MIWIIVCVVALASLWCCYTQIRKIKQLDVPSDVIEKTRRGEFGFGEQMAVYFMYWFENWEPRIDSRISSSIG